MGRAYHAKIRAVGIVSSMLLAGVMLLPGLVSALSVGDVGPWTQTTDLNIADTTTGAVAYNGYVYLVGGRDDSFAALNEVQYAKINADGSVGAWTTSPNVLPSAQWRSGIVEANGYLYSLGGLNSSAIDNVYYAQINPDGSVGAWASTTSLPAATHSMATVAYGGYVYVFGGAGASNVNTVESAPIAPDGSLGAWTATTSLPQAERRQKAIVYDGYVYVFGGLTGSNSTAIVSAKLNNDGTVGPWTTLSVALPDASIDFSVSENGGYVYLLGGNDGSDLDTVYFAQLNSDGSLGAWTQSADSLPQATLGLSSVVYNNVLYVIGGQNGGAAALRSVYYAPLTIPTGSPSATSTTSSSAPGAPDTGHGSPSGPGMDTVVLMVSALVAVGSGLRLIYRHERSA